MVATNVAENPFTMPWCRSVRAPSVVREEPLYSPSARLRMSDEVPHEHGEGAIDPWTITVPCMYVGMCVICIGP